MRSVSLIQGNVSIAANVLLDLNLQGTWLVRFAKKTDLLYFHLPVLKTRTLDLQVWSLR